jgi:hypothetical protein
MAFPRLFRIFYSILFTVLNIVLLVLLLITPADAIQQALNNNQLYNVFVIAGCYLLTLILVIIIYASSLYTNRTVLATIPKTWVPVEKGDVGKSVRKMIVESLVRSAVIAWNARPRISDYTNTSPPQVEAQVSELIRQETLPKPSKYQRLRHKRGKASEKDERGISIPSHAPIWGEIIHKGWSPPSSPDLPNLQYVTVVLELPHLIEAKAVSLAPPDPLSTTTPPMVDLRAIELLQRPAAMSLRDYLSHLTSLGVLPPTTPATTFLSAYECARFSSQPRTEHEFRELMRLFADILRSMKTLDPAILDSSEDDNSDVGADASSTTTSEAPHSPSIGSSVAPSSRSGSQGTISKSRSRSRTLGATLSAVPATPKGKKREQEPFVERSPSVQSFSQTKRPYPVSQSSSSSLRSTSASGGSVIKLSLSRSADPDELPYTLHVGN